MLVKERKTTDLGHGSGQGRDRPLSAALHPTPSHTSLYRKSYTIPQGKDEEGVSFWSTNRLEHGLLLSHGLGSFM